MVELDYNAAYSNLTQARSDQLGADQQRYIFVEFTYTNDMLRNVYQQKDNDQDLLFKIEINPVTNNSGNVFIVKKSFYPEALYDYVTFNLDDELYDFYLKNQFNPKYQDIDLRVVWYFVALDKDTNLFIKKVRSTKYVFSYKRLCEAFDYPERNRSHIKICCKNLGLIKKGDRYLCPHHFSVDPVVR